MKPADQALDSLLAAAEAEPDNVSSQLAAAYACDREGLEQRAVGFYERASALGVPAADLPEFIVGFGSTLRNVGRVQDALRVLEPRAKEAPTDHAVRCILALTHHSAGSHHLAIAELLDVALSLRDASAPLRRYQRALGEYRDELRAQEDRAREGT